MKFIASSIVVLIAGLAFACGPAQDPQSPSVGLRQPVNPPQAPDLGHDASRVEVHPLYGIWIASIQMTCSGPDPYFAFDSSKPAAEDQPTMQNLVSCMKIGPLVGKSIVVIGRTDPRGTDAYNEKLGMDRAEKVKQYLVSRGIDPSRVQTKSVGKDDASLAPKDWPSDRRVEIQVVLAPS